MPARGDGMMMARIGRGPHDGMVERFNIVAWSAIAAGLEAPEQWRQWALAPQLPAGDVTVALA
ncbi:MAG: hypothetical protein ACK4MU_07515, partial [Thermomonas sp.]